ncbi:MAG: hypothetical protein ACRCWP_06215 [Shewanella sp.]
MMQQILKPLALETPGVNIHSGLNISALLNAISQAEHIVLHAAIYSNFATNAVGELLSQRLADDQLKTLTLIQLEPSDHWRVEFAAVLRPSMPISAVETLYSVSSDWCRQLKQRFPNAVNLLSTQALAFQPILLLDDQLFVGHYAHSQHTSAQGVWLEFDTLALGLRAGTLTHWLQNGVPQQGLSSWECAIGRYVEECHQAMNDLWLHALVQPNAGLLS